MSAVSNTLNVTHVSIVTRAKRTHARTHVSCLRDVHVRTDVYVTPEAHTDIAPLSNVSLLFHVLRGMLEIRSLRVHQSMIVSCCLSLFSCSAHLHQLDDGENIDHISP